MRDLRALSLVEVVISFFLLSFVALGVLSMSRMAFVSQRRNQHSLAATVLAESTLNEARMWARDPQNYLSDWAAYNGPLASPSPTYKISGRSTFQTLLSPAQALENQWASTPPGQRELPKGVVLLEIKVAWSPKNNGSIRLVGYIGEPRRDLTGYQVSLDDPQPAAVHLNDTATYPSVIVKDAQGRPFENLLFRWSASSDYLSLQGPRNGRSCKIVRDKIVAPPVPPPPDLLPVQCFASYAGTPIKIVPKPLGLLP
ncbi:MAG: hypothetical protein U0931_38585 [Vulcanimicrobiota bacterium]